MCSKRRDDARTHGGGELSPGAGVSHTGGPASRATAGRLT